MRRLWAFLAALFFLLPVAWMATAALQEEGRALQEPFRLPAQPQVGNFSKALQQMGAFDEESNWRGFARLVGNTVVVTVFSILFQLFTCSLAGYAFARLRFAGRDLLFLLVLATMMLPLQVTTIPQFMLFRWLGWIDTLLPLIVPALLGGSPFFIFLFRQYFRTIPRDVIEAARMDGCGWWGVYWRVMLPLSRPLLATVAIFTFLGVWNDLWTPLIYLTSPENQTLTLALAGFSRTYRVAVELLMAAATVILLPGLLLYVVAQKHFVKGVQLTATKG